MADTLFDTPIGPLYAVASEDGLERLEFVRGTSRIEEAPPSGHGGSAAEQVLAATRQQLDEYFAGERRAFDLPLNPIGSPFQLRVWKAIADIPFGEVLSYGELAIAAGSPGAFRAAGSACGVNRITIIIPCHRIVAANRAIGGYGGGLEIKRSLLRLEGSLAGLRDAQGALAFI